MKFLEDFPKGSFLPWLSFFFFLALSAVTIQFLIIPKMLGSLQRYPGLLLDGDWEAFHLSAIATAQFLKEHGWRAWSPFMGYLGPTPNLVAPFYLLFAPQPWAFIPASAMVHATSGLILFQLLKRFSWSAWWAYAGAFIFMALPSGALAYSQLHKDSFAILGFYLVLFAWVNLLDWHQKKLGFGRLLLALFANYAGFTLIWVMRAHQLKPLFLVECLCLFLILIDTWRRDQRPISFIKLMAPAILFLSIPLSFPYLRDGTIAVPERFTMLDSTGKKIDTQVAQQWTKSALLPDSVDRQLELIGVVRRGFIFYGRWGTTSLDLDVNFRSASDVLAYIPRALQIGILAPFPNQWFRPGPHPTSRLFSAFGSLETILFYLLVPFLLLAVVRFLRQTDLWIILLFSVTSILSHSMVVLNIGTLHRQRIGYLMVLFGLGVCGLSWFFAKAPKKLSGKFSIATPRRLWLLLTKGFPKHAS